MTERWAVVAYEDGRAIKALMAGAELWATANSTLAYDAMSAAKNAHPEKSWALVCLRRGTETNLLLEIGK